MYNDLVKFPIRHEKLHWEAREALLDVHGIPHLFMRIKLSGTKFPLFAQAPDAWIGKIPARHVLVSEDQMSVRAYFSLPIPESGEIRFGHAGRAELEFGSFSQAGIVKLDRKRLPENVVTDEKQ
jgi:hypothetical protein